MVGVVGARCELVLRRVHGVGPTSCSGQAELAVTTSTLHVCLSSEQIGSAVHVGGGQSAVGALNCIALSEAGRAVAPDHGSVVGAGEGDGDQLGGAVGRHSGEAVGVVLPAHKRVLRRVHGVGPHACRAQAEFTPTAGACGVGLGLETLLTEAVLIGDGERAGSGLGLVAFGDGTGDGATDEGRIVDVGHAHGQGLVGEAACAVGGAHGHVVDVVGTRVRWSFVVGRDFEGQHAGAGIQVKTRSVGAAQAVGQAAAGLAGLCGVHRGGGHGVFCDRDGSGAGENGCGQHVHAQSRAGGAFVAGSVGQGEGQGIRAGAQRGIGREGAG